MVYCPEKRKSGIFNKLTIVCRIHNVMFPYQTGCHLIQLLKYQIFTVNEPGGDVLMCIENDTKRCLNLIHFYFILAEIIFDCDTGEHTSC